MIQIVANLVDITEHRLAVTVAFRKRVSECPEDVHAAVQLVFVHDVDLVGIDQCFRQDLGQFEMHRFLHFPAERLESLPVPARLYQQFADNTAETVENRQIIPLLHFKENGEEHMPAKI